jgi:outer membrane protein
MSVFSLPARLLTAARAAVLAAGAAAGLAAAADAQAVLVMNEERILRESAVGQHIASELERIGQEIQAELQALSQPIEEESERLNSETAALSQEAIAQRPDLISRIQQLQQQAAEYERRRQVLSQELVITERTAMQPVLQELQTVLSEIFSERSASVLLERADVVFAGESVNITQDAISRLNDRISTTPVSRVRLTEEQLRQLGLAQGQRGPRGQAPAAPPATIPQR